MNSLWKTVRTAMTAIGAVLVFGAVSASDYYVIELGQPEPSSVWTTLAVGFILMLPTVVHLICKEWKEKNDVQD